MVLLIPLLLVIAVWLTLRAVRWLSQATVRLLEPVRNWANGRDTWLRRQILSLLDPQRPEVQGLIALGALLVAGLWLFLGVLEDVLSGEPLVRADRAVPARVFQLLQSLRVVPIDRIVVAITELGDAPVTIAVALVVLVWLAWHRAWHAVVYGAAAVAGGAGFALLLKVTLQQPRPGPSICRLECILVSQQPYDHQCGAIRIPRIARWARGRDALACRRGADRRAVGFVHCILPAVSRGTLAVGRCRRAALSAGPHRSPETLRSSLEWLSPQAGLASLPVLPRLDHGHSEGRS